MRDGRDVNAFTQPFIPAYSAPPEDSPGLPWNLSGSPSHPGGEYTLLIRMREESPASLWLDVLASARGE